MIFKKPYSMLEKIKSVFSTEKVTAIFATALPKHNSVGKKSKTESQYGNMLRESRKLRLLYGNLSKKYLQKIFQKSCFSPSRKVETIFSILESRLDVVLYRAAFFESIAAAKQIIRLGGIKVNEKKVISPGYIVGPGDIVRVLEKKKDLDLLQKRIYHSYLKSSGILPYTDLFMQNKVFSQNQIAKSKKISHLNSSLRVRPNVFAHTGNATFNDRKKIGWRFQGSFFLLSLINWSKKGKLITLVNQSLRFGKFKKDEKSNVALLALFNKENKIDYLQNNSFGIINKFQLNNAVESGSVSSFMEMRSPSFEREKLLKVAEGKENAYFSYGNPEGRAFFSSRKSNTKSRLVKQLSFLDFYQHKVKTDSTGSRFVLLPQETSHEKIKEKEERFEKKLSRQSKNSKFNRSNKYFISKYKTGLPSVANFQFALPLCVRALATRRHGQERKLSEKFTLSNNFIFCNYLLNLRKQFLSLQKKSNCFEIQKKQSFFKEQTFFESKKIKPLHLEVSYRSLCIIFLFPPQRVCFPSFINLPLIYK